MAPVEREKLYAQLKTLIAKPRRPLLTHITADLTWLMSFPIPATQKSLAGKAYFHVLCDPWLSGPASQGPFGIGHHQSHVEDIAFQNIAEILELISEIETIALGRPCAPENNQIDAVVISHKNSDHTHKPSLIQVSSSVPIFAVEIAVPEIKSWNHFSTVIKINKFSSNGTKDSLDWRKAAVEPLPPWLSLWHISPVKPASGDLHFAIMTTYQETPNSDAEAILNAPHGVFAEDVKILSQALPEIKTLALLHNWNETNLAVIKTALGAHNGLKVQRETSAKYWLRSHDEEVKYRGFTSLFLRSKGVTVEDALEKEGGARKMSGEELDLEKPLFLDVDNGPAILLE